MTNLKEFYNKTLEQLPEIGLGILVLLAFILASWLIKKTVSKRIKPKSKNPLLASFMGKIVAFAISLIGFVFFLQIIGLGGIAKHIVAGAGITTFVLGFAFKDIGENFLSGIILAFNSPFKIGDLIETQGTVGYAYELSMRVTAVKTLDGKDVFIPNSQIIKSPFYNYTIDGFLRYEMTVGVDYDSDLNQAIQAIHSCLSEIDEVLKGEKKPVVVIDELSVSTVNIRIYYWIDTSKSKVRTHQLSRKSELTQKILDKLKKQGIYLPADIIEIKNYNDQTILTNMS